MNQPAATVGAGRRLRLRSALLALLVLAGFIFGAAAAWPLIEQSLAGLGPIRIGLLASFVAGMFTVVGALPIFLVRRIGRGLEDTMMGFGAGVMLAATAFELVLPAVDGAQSLYGSAGMAIVLLAVGVGLGGGTLLLIHRLVPHEHFFTGPESVSDPMKVRRIMLFIFAITLHNFPEGLAVGVGFGGDFRDGATLALGIGLQNIPEGMIVAVALVSLGYSRATAVWVTLLTGLVEPVGGVVGVTAVTLMETLLPWALAFAAGAMLFVVSHEIIPESHREGNASRATLGLLVGFVALIAIDLSLGG